MLKIFQIKIRKIIGVYQVKKLNKNLKQLGISLQTAETIGKNMVNAFRNIGFTVKDIVNMGKHK